MTEANSASPSPSNGTTNGSSAATAPAPGVSTPTPTPKNGEGAVAPAPAKPAGWSPIKRELPFNDGRKLAFELRTEEDLDRHLYKSEHFDKTHKERLRLEKENAELLRLAKESPREFLKAAGHDWQQLMKSAIEEELRTAQMTQEQRAVEQARREAQRIKKQEAERYEQLQREHQELLQRHEWAQQEPHWRAALEKRGRLGDEAYLTLLSQVGVELSELNLSPEQVATEADERWASMVESYLDKAPVETLLKRLQSRLTPQQLWSLLGDDTQRKALMSEGLKWHKSLKGTQSATPPPVQPKREEPREYMTPAEWAAERAKRR